MSNFSLLLTGEITDSYFGEISTNEVKKLFYEAKQADSTTITLTSPGGDVTLATTIKNILDECKNVTIDIVGLAASSATIIACANNAKVRMRKGSLYMIHNPWSANIGDSESMQKTADVLNKFKEQIIAVYHQKTGLSSEKLSKMMDDETWLSDKEALELGFVDEIDNSYEVNASFKGKILNVAGFRFDCSKYLRTSKQEEIIQMVKNEKEIDTVKALTERYPALCEAMSKEVYNKAYAKGVEDERERIKALDDIQTADTEGIINEAKYQSCISARDCAYQIQLNARNKALQNRKNREEDAGALAPIINNLDTPVVDDGISTEIKAILEQFK